MKFGPNDPRSGLYVAPPPRDPDRRIEYRPRIRYVVASRLVVGDVVLESRDHPAVVTRIARTTGYLRSKRTIYCRYVWQHPSEKEWPLGTFAHDNELRKAI